MPNQLTSGTSGADQLMTDHSAAAATHGGPGWKPRTAKHDEEVCRGALWRTCGLNSEFGRLREVLLSWPSESLATPEDADSWLMIEWPDLQRLRRQTEEIAAFYASQGVEVHMHRPVTPPPPNYLFMRDLIFMTPEGAILCRPAALQRAGEERFAAAALADLGIPILRTLRGLAHFEGADALWADTRTVLVGVGRRTNTEGLAQVRSTLEEQGASVIAVPMPPTVQHLLGLLVFVNADLALVDSGRAPEALRRCLQDRGIGVLDLPADDELLRKRGMNVVVLGPRRLVMPSGCPSIRRRLEQAGLEVHEIDVSEYVRAAGALGCLTAVLRRDLSVAQRLEA